MAEQPEPDTDGDLEYDLAHEGAAPRHPPTVKLQPIVVITETADTEADYSYDLAHDIPRQQSPHSNNQ